MPMPLWPFNFFQELKEPKKDPLLSPEALDFYSYRQFRDKIEPPEGPI
jgi:hypothetical protein